MNVQITPTQARLIQEHRERQERIRLAAERLKPKPKPVVIFIEPPKPAEQPSPISEAFKEAWALIDGARIEHPVESIIRATCHAVKRTALERYEPAIWSVMS